MNLSRSRELAKGFLGREVEVVMDRPLGSRHPRYPELIYEVNYGFVPGTRAADGRELDVYYLGIEGPVECATGVCIAVVHRYDDDKLVVVPPGVTLTDAKIMGAVAFQERFFKTQLIR